ncbi:holin [Micrococcales bacterium 31B]|nr:holin [Micrococcales bacterium 31B]
MWTKHFWIDAAERSLKTLAQTLLASGFTDATGILNLDVRAIASVALSAAVLSILSSLVSEGINQRGSASLAPPDPDAKL